MKTKLTSQRIRTPHAADKPYEVLDSEIKGFRLRVQPSGVMAYYSFYR